jgi:hypothetical protein
VQSRCGQNVPSTERRLRQERWLEGKRFFDDATSEMVFVTCHLDKEGKAKREREREREKENG